MDRATTERFQVLFITDTGALCIWLDQGADAPLPLCLVPAGTRPGDVLEISVRCETERERR